MNTGPNEPHHPHLRVACALIERDGRLLAAQRSATMSMPLKWEFPGGKLDQGENPRECLKREVLEELGVQVAIVRPLTATTHRYPGFTVTLYPFVCTISAGEIVPHEHAALAWLTPEALYDLDWAEADFPILAEYLRSPVPGSDRDLLGEQTDFS